MFSCDLEKDLNLECQSAAILGWICEELPNHGICPETEWIILKGGRAPDHGGVGVPSTVLMNAMVAP